MAVIITTITIKVIGIVVIIVVIVVVIPNPRHHDPRHRAGILFHDSINRIEPWWVSRAVIIVVLP